MNNQPLANKQTIYFPAKVWKQLRQLAIERNERGGASALVREAVDIWLREQEVDRVWRDKATNADTSRELSDALFS